MKLSAAKAADRERMAQAVEALADELGVAHEREGHNSREICVKTELRGVGVWLTFDGDDSQDKRGEFCLAWCMNYKSEGRLTDAFGILQRASVNPHHRRKCTAFAEGFDDLLVNLRKGWECINSGDAFIA
jgi:hypothetical protein